MNTTKTRAMLALSGVFVWLAASAPANELRFSDLETRLSSIEHQLESQQGVQTAAFLSDDGNGNGNGNGNGACGYDTCGSSCCDTCCGCCDSCCAPCGHWYSEVQLLWLRTHVLSDFAGKLSERHYFAPRFVVGYEDACGVGARARYFHWGNTVPIVGGDVIGGLNGGPGVRFEWDVYDLEATGRLKWGGTDVVFAGGFRYADWNIADAVEADLYGLTFATDARTLLCCECNSTWSAVYGARLSVLGGDWDNVGGGVFAFDDNVLVRELYLGVEYRCSYCGYDLYSRLTYEMQNWHSDMLAQNANTDSIGLIGPGIHFGATF